MPDSAYYRTQAARCRRLAKAASDKRSAQTLNGMADDYDRQAGELERGGEQPEKR